MNIEDSKQELLEYIDDLKITKDLYKILTEMYLHYDERLFVKIIEEIKDGNLSFYDFTRTFKNIDFLNTSLEGQEKLYRENKLMKEHLAELHDVNVAMNYSPLLNSKNEVIDIEKQNILLSELSIPSDDSLTELYRTTMLRRLTNSSTSAEMIDAMLLSVHDYIVPVDFDKIILNKFDIKYAEENGLTTDEMKKIKSLAAFTSNYFD